MSTTHPSFYVTGGTLQSNAASYVRRRADEDLYEGLSRGNICYVLTSRQMGKSSLMVSTAARLRAEGVTVAVIDLTAIGQNLTAEQWYDGLLSRVGRQLDLEDELEDFWEEHERVGPLQRWMMAVREVVLKHRRGRIVIFVDEIDVVRTLPFTTDEFFAGIREFYNRRTEDPELARLTFCLLGVATPSDLIRDTRTTPFNIGQRVELTDFTEAEAAALADGLERPGNKGRELLNRILYWTGGHPYLTQRLCQSVAEDEDVTGAGGVDRLCEELFLSSRARERDDNLLFVRERMLRSEVDRASLLDLYLKARSHKSVKDDETNTLVSVLRLSGITRAVEGFLLVRNRIYFRVFDREWVVSNMPDAEVRRQKAAYRRGMLRAASVAAIVLLLMSGLAAWALAQKRTADEQRSRAEVEKHRAELALATAHEEREKALRLQARAEKDEAEAEAQRKEAEAQRKEAEAQRKLAVEQKEAADKQRAEAESQRRQAIESARARELEQQRRAEAERDKVLAEAEGQYTKRLLYAVHMNQAHAAWDDANVGRVRKLLDKYAPPPEPQAPALADPHAGLRGFEWYYLRRLIDRDIADRRVHVPQPGEAFLSAFSRDRRKAVVATRDEQGLVKWAAWKVWDVSGNLPPAADRPDERRQARELSALGNLNDGQATALSPDGGVLASGHRDETVKLWDAATGKLLKEAHTSARIARARFRRELTTLNTEGVIALAFSPDGRVLASGDKTSASGRGSSSYGTLTLRDAASLAEIASAPGLEGGVTSLAFSPDSRVLVTGHGGGRVMLWDVPPRGTGELPFKRAAALEAHEKGVSFIAFSANGKAFATGSEDGTVKFWNLGSRKRVGLTLAEHGGKITFITFSPDGRLLATGSADKTVRVWGVALEAGTRRDTFGEAHDAAPSWGIETASLTTGGAGNFSPPAVSFAPRKLLAAAAPAFGTEPLIDSSQSLATFKGHDGPVLSLTFSADAKTLTSFGADNTLRSWPVNAAPEWKDVGRFGERVFGVAYSPDGGLIAAGSFLSGESSDGPTNVKVWDAASGAQRFAFRMNSVNSLVFSGDGRRLAVAGAGAALKVWDMETGRELPASASGLGPSAEKERVDYYSVSLSPDGKYMAAGDSRGTVTIWDAATLREVHRLTRAHEHGIEAVPFSPDGKLLATTSHDGTVRLWETGTWRALGPPVVANSDENDVVEAGGIKSASFSPDGKLLVTGGTDRVAKLWEVAKLLEGRSAPTARLLLEGHSGPITFISFSPDGNRIATASTDDTVRLWDTASGQEVAVLRGHHADVWVTVFSPRGGDTIVTGGADGTVKLWRSTPSPAR